MDSVLNPRALGFFQNLSSFCSKFKSVLTIGGHKDKFEESKLCVTTTVLSVILS